MRGVTVRVRVHGGWRQRHQSRRRADGEERSFSFGHHIIIIFRVVCVDIFFKVL